MKLKKSRIFFAFVLLLSCAGEIFPRGFFALHNYHTTLTRIDYKEKEKLVEISVQLFTHDFVPALERRAGKPIDLEKTSDIDKIIFNYLNENFVLKDKTGAAKKLVWVGKEVSVDTIYVYVESRSEESLEGYKLQDTFFFNAFPEQTNLVIARYGGVKADLLFKPGDGFKEIKLTKSIEEN